MNIDLKIEADKIAFEVINGTVDQAYEDYEYFLGNCRFLTSVLDKNILTTLGTNISKFVRKSPENFLNFCKLIWYNSEKDGKMPVGIIMASLENFIPELVINEAIEMCRKCEDIDEVDYIVTGFEPVILRKPDDYFSLLDKHIKDKNIFVKRLIIITVGHIMYRHKTAEITNKCLEMIRPELENGDESTKKVTSWVIGSYGVRADQNTVAEYIQSFESSENPTVVWTFSDAIRKSKISLQADVAERLIVIFEGWSKSKNLEIKKSALTALKALNGG